MAATVTEPTYLSNHERGICLHGQARFRFGKYKGFRVRDVWEADTQYLRWLTGQDWFVEKQQTLVTLDEPPFRGPRARRTTSPSSTAAVR